MAGGHSGEKHYLRDIYLLSAGFFGLFLSFNTSQGLETTLNSNKKLADTSLAVLYAMFCGLAIFAPKIVEWTGPKAAMIIGGAPYALTCLTNIPSHRTYYLSVPAFGLVGLGAAVLWTGQGVYLGRCALNYARQTGESEDSVTSRFNGIFFSAFQFNGAIGTLISALLFNNSSSSVDKTAKYLYIGLACCAGIGTSILLLCETMPPAKKPSSGAGGAGAVDDQKLLAGTEDQDVDGDDADGGSNAPVSLVETLKLAVFTPQMTLAIPIILYNGMSLGFMFSDYPLFYADQDDGKTKRFMSSKDVGFVLATFYIVNSAASYLFGKLVRVIGRRGCMTLATVCHIVFYIVLLVVNSESVFKSVQKKNGLGKGIAYLMAAVFATGDAVWESQVPALLQTSSFLPRERDRDAAMGNLKIWQSLGFAIQFVFGFIINKLAIKLWILLAVMIVSAVALVYINSSVIGLDADTPAARVSKVKILDDTEGSYGTAADAEKPLLVDEH